MQPELRALEQELLALREEEVLASAIQPGGTIAFEQLELAQIAELLSVPAAAILLMAAADLNRTALRSGLDHPDAQLVAPQHRRAFVVKSKLPASADFTTVVRLALQRRSETLERSANAATETLFRERLEFEGIPIRMRGAWTSGILIDRRKPDGVYPDPDSGLAPRLYLEVKKINRVRDDIQKRLYEIAEVSLEVKFLYGGLALSGLDLTELIDQDGRTAARAELRTRTIASSPAVAALLICRSEELEIAKRYRPGAEAFIDRVFFSDEIDQCIEYLAATTSPE
jgi:hypothetical protein